MAVRPTFWLGLAVLAAINLGYAVWAVSQPHHEAEPYTMFLDVPAASVANVSVHDVADGLRAAGWSAEVPDTPGPRTVSARPVENPEVLVQFHGLEGDRPPLMTATQTCMIGYPDATCPGNDDWQLRTWLHEASVAAGVAVDARHARLDDNDFETLGEFILCAGQGLMLVFSIPVAVAMASAARVRP